MAERRMFTKAIIGSDIFLDMPLTSQALYFHLAMRADDDGFVNNPRKILRMIGASDDDCKLLIAKRFILVFESGIIVIKHWKMHNYIQRDRYKPTIFQGELSRLTVQNDKSYEEVSPRKELTDMDASLEKNLPESACIQDVYKSDTQVRLGEVSVDQSNNTISSTEAVTKAENNCNCDEIVSAFNQVCISLPKVREVTDRRCKAMKSLKAVADKYGGFQRLFELAEQSDFLSGRNGQWKGCGFDWLLKPSNAVKVFEGNYTNETNKEAKDERYRASERYGTVI